MMLRRAWRTTIVAAAAADTAARVSLQYSKIDLSQSLAVSHSQIGGASCLLNALQNCGRCHEPMFPSSLQTAPQTASSAYRPLPYAHSIWQRTPKFVPRVDRISSWSLAGLVVVEFSQVEQQVRAGGSSSINGRAMAGVALTSGLLLG